MIETIPKVELHCHIEGAAHPDLVKRLARKYDIDVSAVIREGRYVWTDFTTFLNAYDVASMVFRSEEDYRLLAYDHYSRLADQHCIYAEVFASPDHGDAVDLSYSDMIRGIGDGIADAKKDFGIDGRIITVGLRHLGPDAVERVAELAAENPHPSVTGFGMAGDERMFPTEPFSAAFSIAADAGLALTSHAGEFGGADSARGALDHLGVARIGHGVRAIEDPDLVARLAREGIVLETCPGSNIALGVFPSFAEHPFAALMEAGVTVTLNTDDPPYFATSLDREYEIAQEHFHCDRAGLLNISRAAVDAAFVGEETRSDLHKRLDNAG